MSESVLLAKPSGLLPSSGTLESELGQFGSETGMRKMSWHRSAERRKSDTDLALIRERPLGQRVLTWLSWCIHL